MRISFDIDDTLVLRPRNRPEVDDGTLVNGDRLREGTIALLKELAVEHELWLYTSSLRPAWLLRLAFRLRGMPITRVINNDSQLRAVAVHPPQQRPTKLSSHFGIDLHIDDSSGVAEEGRRHDFDASVVDPGDADLAQKVRAQVQ